MQVSSERKLSGEVFGGKVKEKWFDQKCGLILISLKLFNQYLAHYFSIFKCDVLVLCTF